MVGNELRLISGTPITLWQGMSILTQTEMKRRFTSTMPGSLLPLVETLRRINPKTNPDEFATKLKEYLRLTTSR